MGPMSGLVFDWTPNACSERPGSVLSTAKDSWPLPAGCWVANTVLTRNNRPVAMRVVQRAVTAGAGRRRSPQGRKSFELGTQKWTGSCQVGTRRKSIPRGNSMMKTPAGKGAGAWDAHTEEMPARESGKVE